MCFSVGRRNVEKPAFSVKGERVRSRANLPAKPQRMPCEAAHDIAYGIYRFSCRRTLHDRRNDPTASGCPDNASILAMNGMRSRWWWVIMHVGCNECIDAPSLSESTETRENQNDPKPSPHVPLPPMRHRSHQLVTERYIMNALSNQNKKKPDGRTHPAFSGRIPIRAIRPGSGSAGVELDDQVRFHLHRVRHVRENRNTQERPKLRVRIMQMVEFKRWQLAKEAHQNETAAMPKKKLDKEL